MIANIEKTMSVNQRTFNTAQKKRDNSQVSWSERMATFWKVGFCIAPVAFLDL